MIILVLAQCIEIIGGSVNTGSESFQVGPGTYCDSTSAKSLAQSILDLNAEIERDKIKIKSITERYDTIVLYYENREKVTNKYYEDRISEITLENKILGNWWNSWGKTALTTILVGAGAIVVTWQIVK